MWHRHRSGCRARSTPAGNCLAPAVCHAEGGGRTGPAGDTQKTQLIFIFYRKQNIYFTHCSQVRDSVSPNCNSSSQTPSTLNKTHCPYILKFNNELKLHKCSAHIHRLLCQNEHFSFVINFSPFHFLSAECVHTCTCLSDRVLMQHRGVFSPSCREECVYTGVCLCFGVCVRACICTRLLFSSFQTNRSRLETKVSLNLLP